MEELINADIPRPIPLLGSWLTTEQINMVYAPSGVGKSMFALSLGLAVAGGGEFLGWKCDEPHKVLIVDGEMGVFDLQERVKLLSSTISGIDLTSANQNLSFLAFQDQSTSTDWPVLSNDEDHEVILDRIRKEGIKLVIFDNLSTLAQVDNENDASSWNDTLHLMRMISRTGCAVLMVHHTRKGNTKGDASFRGSQVLSVLLSCSIRLLPVEGAGTSFTLEFDKFRNKKSRETDTRNVTLSEAGWEYEIPQLGKVYEVIEAIRSREYASQKEVSEGLKWSTGEVSKVLRKAYEQGLFTSEEKQKCFEEAKDVREDNQAFFDDF